MKRRFIIILASLVMIAIVTALVWRRISLEPIYQGKRVSVWFEEYVRTGEKYGYTFGPTGRLLNSRKPDPEWDALRALGSNAVPFLVTRLTAPPTESPLYFGIFERMPAFIQRHMRIPGTRQQQQYYAATALAGLGEVACSAYPAMQRAMEQNPRLSQLLNTTLRFEDDPQPKEVFLRLADRQEHGEAVALLKTLE